MPLNKLSDSGQRVGTPDVQTTTFSADGVSRFICNNWDEVIAAQGSHPFDIVIVGSGMYGGYCAAKLFEFGEQLAQQLRSQNISSQPIVPRILVIESGPYLINQHIQNLPRVGALGSIVERAVVDPSQVLPQGAGFVPHHRCVGGKSLFWGGWTPRLTDDDFAKDWPKEVIDALKFSTPKGSPKSVGDGYEAVEFENGTWPVADFINGKLFEIFRANASEVLSDASRPTKLLPNPGFKTAAIRAAWIDFKNKSKAAVWNGLKAEEKAALFKALDAIGAELDAPPEFCPVNPTIAVLGDSPGSGLFAMDKFSSLPLLIDAIRDAKGRAGDVDQKSRLFLLPNAEVLKLETSQSVVQQVVIGLRDPFSPDDRDRSRVVRLDLKPGALVVLAGNTINSTRLALNSVRRPAQLEPNQELIGRNLMAHVRGNFFWRINREALNVPPELPSELETAALHVRGKITTSKGQTGQFHFQFYATPNLADDASSPEQFLYIMVPNIEDLQRILESQRAGKIVVGIRNTGETFGDRTSSLGSNFNSGWISVNPFGGTGDDVYRENGAELRIPKVFVNLVETSEDSEVRNAQSDAAFEFIAKLTGQSVADVKDTSGTKPVQFLNPGTNQNQDRPGTTYHESGTLWMGTDYTKSVTDSNGRLHHVSNLYCTDQAIFPSVGSANPVNTGLALTRKIARSIVKRFESAKLNSLEPGFQQLYTGNISSDGWQYVGPKFNGQVPFFDVTPEAGVPIIGAGFGEPGFDSVLGVLWYTKRTFGDFVLKLDWRAFDIHANSGIFIRTPKPVILDDQNYYNSATEIQIDERGYRYDPPNSFYGSPLHKTGSVYGIFPAQQWAAKIIGPRGTPLAGLWNSYEIRAQGPSLEVILNDKLVAKGRFASLQPAGSPDATNSVHTFKRSDGFIGLQCHTEHVQFRNIRIQ